MENYNLHYNKFKGFWSNKDIDPEGVIKDNKLKIEYNILYLLIEGMFQYYEYWTDNHFTLEVLNLDILDKLNLISNKFNELSLQHKDTILAHNKKLILAKKELDKDVYKKYIEDYIKWRGYNTPNPSSLDITPLYGTELYNFTSDWLSPWVISISMLSIEYNTIKKALIYMTCKDPTSLPIEYKNCFIYWQTRQNLILEEYLSIFSKLDKGNIDLGNTFIPLFSLNNEYLLREVIEDFLYIALNILLAKSIIENTKIKENPHNKELYYKELSSIYNEHFMTYKTEYDYLYKIREYNVYHFVSLEELKNIAKYG